MSEPHGAINHVSDTALMAAACRALESEEAGGLVRDPFAARLAGERGMAILRELPHSVMMRFGIGVRTHFIDELVLDTIASNPIATVLSVGCGLDTRPWRLDLPADLRWIEVDFADMLDYKEGLMSAETPRCRYERLTADLNNPAGRQALYAAAGAAPALLITEGLLMYLPGATIEALAGESLRQTGVTHWIVDISSSDFVKALNPDSMRSVRHVQADDHLPGEQILDTVHRHGWAAGTLRSYLHDVGFAIPRLFQLLGDAPRPVGPLPVPPSDPTGVHRLVRP